MRDVCTANSLLLYVILGFRSGEYHDCIFQGCDVTWRCRYLTYLRIFFFRSCTVHSDNIHSSVSQINAQPFCFKILKFTLKCAINAPTCFDLTKPSSGSLQSVLR